MRGGGWPRIRFFVLPDHEKHSFSLFEDTPEVPILYMQLFTITYMLVSSTVSMSPLSHAAWIVFPSCMYTYTL